MLDTCASATVNLVVSEAFYSACNPLVGCTTGLLFEELRKMQAKSPCRKLHRNLHIGGNSSNILGFGVDVGIRYWLVSEMSMTSKHRSFRHSLVYCSLERNMF